MRLTDKKFYEKKAEQPQTAAVPSTGELFDLLAQQFGPNMPPQADPNGPPVQDKVQQYKDMGLNDQQVEQVMKMAAPPPEEQPDPAAPPETEPPAPAEPPGEFDGPPVQAPAMPPSLPDLNQQQPPLEPLQVKDLMDGKSVQEKQNTILSFVAWVAKLQDQWQKIYSALEGVTHSPGPKVYKDWNEKWDEYQQIQQALSNPEEIGKLPPATQQALRKRLQDIKKELPEQHNMLPKGSPAEKKALQRQLQAIQGKLSYAGSIYKQLFTHMQPRPAKPAQVVPARGIPGQPNYRPEKVIPAKPEQPGMEEHEAIQWLKQKLQEMAGGQKPMEMPMQPKPEPVNIGDKEINRVDQQGKPLKPKTQSLGGDTLSTPEMDGTGKIGQQMPAAPPGGGGGDPGGPPMPAAPPGPGGGQPMDPGMVEEKAEDPRSLEEILSGMKEDFEALDQKIQKGDAILDGQEVEPVETDSGAMPSPAPMVASEKEAVDEEAKEYYHDYYGGYGDAMTKDRVAEIVDMIDELATDYGVVLTNDQVRHATQAIELSGNFGGTPAEAFMNRTLMNYLFKTGQVFHISSMLADEDFWHSMRITAMNTLPSPMKDKWYSYVQATNRAADSKIKKPKINEQQPDSEKVEHLKDKAEKGEQTTRPAHLKVELDDHCVEGAYLKLTLKWDPSDEAAKRSDDGLKQMVLSHVKGLESKKEFLDLGWLGQISFDEFDPEAGMAVVSVRTKKPADAPTRVKTSS